jgi:hypothetical protein
MNDQQTCGKGLAEHARLPAKLAELIGAMAEILELHQKTLDRTDDHAREELDAYVSLAKKHRTLAAELRATAEEMAGYRDLPMARHDRKAMTDPKLAESFARFTKAEGELLDQLQTAVGRDRAMLAEMRAAR